MVFLYSNYYKFKKNKNAKKKFFYRIFDSSIKSADFNGVCPCKPDLKKKPTISILCYV